MAAVTPPEQSAGTGALAALRSLLFVPASRPDLIVKAQRSGADSLIIDLEDAVAPDAKAAARESVAQAVAEAPESQPIFVRVNHPSTGGLEADLDAAVAAGTRGIVIPKVESVADVVAVDDGLRAREPDRGLAEDSIAILPLVESCRGLHFAYDIAIASPRVAGMAFSSGEDGDFMADLDGQWTPAGEAMFYPRSKLVCETRAAGLDWPVDGVCMHLDDDAILRSECRLARRLGYTAKLAIHPRQLATIHEIFTPSKDEIAYSEGLLATLAEATAAGVGVVRYRGTMIDKANARSAERTLARARRARFGFAHSYVTSAGPDDADVRKTEGGAAS